MTLQDVDSSNSEIPMDRTNLKVRREYGATNYEAYALPGVADTDFGWQIAVITREAAAPHSVLSRNFAQDANGKETNGFVFQWSNRAALTYGV